MNTEKFDQTYKPDAEPPKRSNKFPNRGTKIIIVLTALVLASSLTVVYFYNRIVANPAQLFTLPAATPSASIRVSGHQPDVTIMPTLTPTPTLSPFEQLQLQADTSIMKDTVNVLLVGVDYAEERETWSGKHSYHSDVMIVVAINFEENRADMISLPRDTYALIPGIDGIYKLNASIDCGGGYPDGLPKVAEAASWMLGGIPVDYYYAVTMPVVKEIVDMIDGVDYDVDVNFEMMGRSYQRGMQRLDGQGVLDYFRVRKNVSQGGDLNRINRQKQLLLALFEEMKEKNLLVTLPQMVKAFDGKLLTNTTFEQTAALGLFAYNLGTENIGMHSMDGPMRNIFNWNFCLTDQTKRVQIIQDIYGIEVPKYDDYSSSGAQRRWNQMRSKKFYTNARNVIAAAETYISSMPSSHRPAPDPTLATPTDKAAATPSNVSTPSSISGTGDAVKPLPEQTAYEAMIVSGSEIAAQARAQLLLAQQALENCQSSLTNDALTVLQSETDKLAELIAFGELSWYVGYSNEIDVDFR